MNRSLNFLKGLSGLLMSCGLLCAQAGVPHYCKTDTGVLGPYPNDGSVKVGDACFGTQNGQRHEGVAVMGKDNVTDDKSKSGLPQYCKTDAGVLGPYDNPGTVKVGDACFGTKNGQRYEGVAVMGKGGDDDTAGGGKGGGSSKGDLPQYCKTDAGVLGPYDNPGTVKVGDACFGTKNGQRYEGVAVMSKSGK